MILVIIYTRLLCALVLLQKQEENSSRLEQSNDPFGCIGPLLVLRFADCSISSVI